MHQWLQDIQADRVVKRAARAFMQLLDQERERRRHMTSDDHAKQMYLDLAELWNPKPAIELSDLYTDPRIVGAAIVTFPYVRNASLSKLWVKHEALTLLPCWREQFPPTT